MTDIGHLLPNTPIHCDNAMVVGIANHTIKCQRSRSMDMRFFWVGDKIKQEMYDLKWHPGQEHLPDYQSKHHIGSHHTAVRPWYLHMDNSPRVLPQAVRPSALKGCVGSLKDGYVCNVPLPRAPRIQSASHVTNQPYADTCYSQESHVPTWSDLVRSLACLGCNILPFSPVWLMQSLIN